MFIFAENQMIGDVIRIRKDGIIERDPPTDTPVEELYVAINVDGCKVETIPMNEAVTFIIGI